MNREYHKWYSPTLNREMELLVFGHGGARMIVFPTSRARFFEYEDRSMVAALGDHIESGRLQLFCVDSVDAESFWRESNLIAREEKADPLITYMHLLYKKAKAKGVNVREITACVLDRPRHEKIIADLRKAGARINLIPDGDVAGAINTAMPVATKPTFNEMPAPQIIRLRTSRPS